MKKNLTKKNWSIQIFTIFILSLIIFTSKAQQKPNSFVLGYSPNNGTWPQYSANGYSSSVGGDYFYTSYSYNLKFGAKNGTESGYNRFIKLFQYEGQSYSLTKAVPGAQPFKRVVINRYGDNPQEKITSLFETATAQSSANNSTVYLVPDYVGTMEELVNSYTINRGTDNVFVRGTSASQTVNNIYRIDMILEEPVIIPAQQNLREQSGFLLMERGGNDAFKVAAILGTTGGENPVANSFQSVPKGITTSQWGSTGQSILSMVMQKDPADGNLRPSQRISSQAIAGVFISLQDLGIPAGTTIYGLSIMGNNVSSDPGNINSFPSSTADSDGGLDFMAGGGFFTKAILIEGKVWVDADGDAIEDSNESGIANNLWANLVDATGTVISSIQVRPNGTYTLFIADNNVLSPEYSVILTNSENYEGDQLNAADPLLNNFVHTGTHYRSSPDTGNKSGVINIGAIGQENITGINFGIERRPDSDNQFTTIPKPYTNDILVLDGLSGLPIMTGSDPEDGVYTGNQVGQNENQPIGVIINTLPDNGELYYDGILVTVQEILDKHIFEDPSLFSIKLTGTGYESVTFTFSYVDAAGLEDLTPATYFIDWNGPLPVTLVYFKASTENRITVLTWSSSTEENNQYYAIERSTNGKNWLPIGRVETNVVNGNSQHELKYSFIDESPINGLNYYRLKQIDRDGQFAYSRLESVYFEGLSLPVIVYPNPTSDNLTVDGLTGIESIRIYNANGQLLKESTPKTESISLSIKELPAGIYNVLITNKGSEIVIKRIVKQ